MIKALVSRVSGSRILSTAAIVLGLSTAQMAAAQSMSSVEFHGGGAVTNLSNCTVLDLPNVIPVRAIYAPSIHNGGVSSVSLFIANGGTINLATWNPLGPGTTTWLRGPGRSIWANFFNWAERPRIRGLEHFVLTPTGGNLTNAEEMFVRMRVRNIEGVAGCQGDVLLALRRVGALPD